MSSRTPVDAIEVDWAIEEGYYLYRNKLSFESNTEGITALARRRLPEGLPHEDEFFGKQQIYRGTFLSAFPTRSRWRASRNDGIRRQEPGLLGWRTVLSTASLDRRDSATPAKLLSSKSEQTRDWAISVAWVEASSYLSTRHSSQS